MKIRKEKGFTLIEIMIVVAIIGIISSIAFPSYVEYVKKGKRTEAKTELLRIAQMQESYFVQNLSYAKDLTQLGFAANTIDSETGLYDVEIDVLNPPDCNPAASPPVSCTGYAVTASIKSTGAQAGDTQCSGYRIDNVGRKWAIGSTGTVTSYPGAGAPSAAHTTKSRACW